MTTRAQLELVMRIGRQLFERGQGDLASELLLGFDGTIATASGSVETASSDPKSGRKAMTGAERQAAYKARRRVTEVTAEVTKGDGGDVTGDEKSDASFVTLARVSESENSRLSGVVSAESETSERVERFEASARVTSPVTKVTNKVTREVTSVTGDVSAEPPHALWRQIFDQWVFIAHHGKSIGKPHQFSQNFSDVARMAEQRSPQDPLAYATEVIRRYVADRRKRGKDLSPRFFAADFGTFADSAPAQPGAAPVDPVVREMRELNAKYADAQARGDAVATATYEQKLKLLGKRILANAS